MVSGWWTRTALARTANALGLPPVDIASCNSQWHPQLSPQAHHLMSLAQHLNPIVSSERLHECDGFQPSGGRLSTESAPPPAPNRTQRKTHQLIEGCQLNLTQPILGQENDGTRFQIKVLPHTLDERIPHQGGNGSYIWARFHITRRRFGCRSHQYCFPAFATKIHVLGFRSISDGGNWCKTLDRTAGALSNKPMFWSWGLVGGSVPLVILEARAAGCPVIAPRIGGIPEIITDGVDGFLYELTMYHHVQRSFSVGTVVQNDTNKPTTCQSAHGHESWYRQLCG